MADRTVGRVVAGISLGTWITLATMVFGGGATYATITANDASIRKELTELAKRSEESTTERKAEDAAIRARMEALQERTNLAMERNRDTQTQVIERMARLEASMQTLIGLFERDRRSSESR